MAQESIADMRPTEDEAQKLWGKSTVENGLKVIDSSLSYKINSFGFTGSAPAVTRDVRPMNPDVPQETQMAPDVHWVGAVDWNVTEFHGYETKNGSSYNAYLILDEQPTLIDTVKYPFAQTLLENISNHIEIAKLKYVLLNHAEPDHTSSLPHLLALNPEITVVTNEACKRAMEQNYDTTTWKWQVFTADAPLCIGKRTLHLVSTPGAHWPDSAWAWSPYDNILYSNDGFGQHFATSRLWDDQHSVETIMALQKEYYANILMPCDAAIRRTLDAVLPLNLPIKKVLTAHGVSWRKHIGEVITAYADYAHQKVNPKIVIIYDSMYQSTQLMAGAFADGAQTLGVEVRLVNAARRHITTIATEVLDAAAIVIGSPCLNESVMPPIAQAVNYVAGLSPKHRLGMCFGSYGWNKPALVGALNNLSQSLKLYETSPAITCQYLPTQEVLKEMWQAGRDTAVKVIEKCNAQINNLEDFTILASREVIDEIGAADGREVAVLFGSTGGTAQAAAAAVKADLLLNNGIKVLYSSMDSFGLDKLVEMIKRGKESGKPPLALFVMATTGDGDFPLNSLEFWEDLNRSTPELMGLKASVFGLGSKSFTNFCRPAKKLHSKLVESGCVMVRDVQCGDALAPGAHRAAFDPWRIGVLKDENVFVDRPPLPRYSVTMGLAKKGCAFDYVCPKGFELAKVAKNELWTPADYEREVHYLDLDIAGLKTKYVAGDHFKVLPRNPRKAVEEFLEAYGLSYNMGLYIKSTSTDVESHIPERLSVGQLFEQHVDLFSACTRGLLSCVWHFTDNDNHKASIKHLLEEGNEDAYKVYSMAHSVADILLHYCPDIPFDILLTVLPEMRPRLYSSASSPLMNPDNVQLLAVLNMWKSPKGDWKRGLCTNFMFNLHPEDGEVTIPIQRHAGILSPPSDCSAPVMLVGLGTGVSAFRAFLQEREGQKKAGKVLGPCTFYYACRHNDKDFVLKKELEEYKKNGIVTDVQTAFSHDQKEFITIPDIMAKNPKAAADIAKHDNCKIFYCGVSFGVPEKVFASIKSACGVELGIEGEELEKYGEKLHERYFVESF